MRSCNEIPHQDLFEYLFLAPASSSSLSGSSRLAPPYQMQPQCVEDSTQSGWLTREKYTECFMNEALAFTGVGIAPRGEGPGGKRQNTYHDFLLRDMADRIELHPLPIFSRRRVTSQDRLIARLAAAWGTTKPRVMVDIGCHASLGRHKNVSDALLWLDRFHAPGGLVLGVDAVEDRAQDLQDRFDYVEPYKSMTAVEKHTMTVAISGRSNNTFDVAAYIRLTRLPFGIELSDGRLTPSVVAANLTRRVWRRVVKDTADATTSLKKTSVPTIRLDTMWRHRLGSRRIDFLKIDIDADWRQLGLLDLLRKRGVAVAVITVYPVWRNPPEELRVSAFDQFVWWSRTLGYDAYLKVPCAARSSEVGSIEGGWYSRAAWLAPLFNASTHEYLPSRFTARKYHVQDVLLVDRQTGLGPRLVKMTVKDCREDTPFELLDDTAQGPSGKRVADGPK
jgi:hypothetical protein